MDEENRSGKLPENSEEAEFTESELRYDDYTDYEDFERRERARRARYVQNYEGTGAETAPAGETPAEAAPVDEMPSEELPAETAPAEEMPSEELSAEAAPAEEAYTEEGLPEEFPRDKVPESFLTAGRTGRRLDPAEEEMAAERRRIYAQQRRIRENENRLRENEERLRENEARIRENEEQIRANEERIREQEERLSRQEQQLKERARAAQENRRREETPAPRREQTEAPRRERTEVPRRERTEAPRRERAEAPRRERTEAPRRERTEAPRRERAEAVRREQAEAARERKRKQQRERQLQRRHEEVTEQVNRRVRKGKVKRTILLLLLILLVAMGVLLYRYLGAFQAGGSPIDPLVNGQAAQDTAMSVYTNIALFGVDSTEGELEQGNNRSDMIMIASIHKLTGEVKLVSVYRDTLLRVSEDDLYTKCNAAYAYGGPQQAVSMLNRNLDLNIRDYATVGFGGLADAIDAVGGIELDIAEEEIHFLNDYQSTMAEPLGKEYIPIEHAGTQTVNGLQATAYCRIRYTAGDDFRRTERQRTVLTKLLTKAKRATPSQLQQLLSLLTEDVSTSLSKTEMLELAAQLVRADVKDTLGFPAPDKIATGMVDGASMVIPVDLKANVVWLHGVLFGDLYYQVSPEVEAISQRVTQITGY